LHRIVELESENARLRRANLRVSTMVERDTATGLYGRNHFDSRLIHEWNRAEHSWTPLSLIVVTVHELQTIREVAGAAAAAHIVRKVAEVLAMNGREVDIPCRIGSDTFAIILPATNRIGAEAEMRRLCELWRSVELPALEGGMTALLALGMAVAIDDAETPLELLMLADDALVIDRRRSETEHPTEPVPRPTWIDAA